MRSSPDHADTPSLATPEVPAPILIETAADLAKHCQAWRALPALAIDTEFVRERTYFPGLGLVQVGDGQNSHLVDVVAIEDLSSLGEVLADPSVTKIFHACGEDLETLYDRFGGVPAPLFDTQVAAAMAGYGAALSYRALAATLCGVNIPKDETRTNWLRRPLTPAQIRYAGLDVTYLLPLYETLNADLVKRGRLGWLAEDLGRLGAVDRFLPDPMTVFQRVKGTGGMSPRQLAVLRALAAWRETTARRRDQPRGFVVTDNTLVKMARDMPRNESDLASIGELSPNARQRFGKVLLRTVRAGRETPPAELPTAQPTPSDPTTARRLVKRLQVAVRSVAQAHDLPPELLANRKTLAGVVLRAQKGDDLLDHPLLRGWRGELIDEALHQALDVLRS